ncbi:MAG: hypothetical protein NVS4B7_06530 [Ktedonobacteraceae bacterium]
MSGLVGTTLGRYSILERLGRGGMSEVYLAYDESMNRNVALKVVGSVHADYIERFHREAEAIGMLNHAHILPAFDYGEQGPWHYMVMPYIQYGTLRDRIQEGPLSLEEAGLILEQVAAALQFAHEQGIVHRDIKPSNILMRDDHYTYLADFGLAKSLEEGSTITQTGNLLGTPEYMAPELSEGPATTSSDLYALGILLYQMVTGQVPFGGETPIAVYWKQLRDEPIPPSQINPSIPYSVERVILRALNKNPTHRYQTANELAEAYIQAITFPDQFVEEDIPTSSIYATAPVEPEPVEFSAAAAIPIAESRLVLPNSPVSAPSATAPPRRRLIRRPLPKIVRKRPSRSGPATPPPLESLTPAVVRDALASESQEQEVLPHQTKPNKRTRLIRRRRSSTSVAVPRRRNRNLVLISLIVMTVFLGIIVLVALPFTYFANQANTQAHIAVATANAVATTDTKAVNARATQQALTQPTTGIANSTLVLQDALNSNTNGRWTENTACAFTDNAYHVRVQQASFLQICSAKTFPITNNTISVDVTLLSGNDAGLLFRTQGQQFYDFEITDQQQFFLRLHNAGTGANYTSLINNTPSNAIVPGGKNTLLVIANGNNFKLFINGTLVGEQQDSTLPSGQIALVAGTLASTTTAEASFANLKIYQP